MLLHQSVCLLNLGLRLAQDHEIVGITHEAKAGVVELPVEAVESDIGEQGGNDSALRRADHGRSEHAFLHHPGQGYLRAWPSGSAGTPQLPAAVTSRAPPPLAPGRDRSENT